MAEAYPERVAADHRRALLAALLAARDGTAHEHQLRSLLQAEHYPLTAVELRRHLVWLDESGLITLLGDKVRVARLTLAGEDVASGRGNYPGVARPLRD